MIKINLPIQTKEFIDEKIITKKTEKEMIVDTSIASQVRFEQQFPELSKNGDLFDYIEMIQNTDPNISKLAIVLSQLKVVYCLFNTDMTYMEFITLFDLSDIEYSLELSNKIKDIFQLVLSGSSEKN